ncbi:hypothetical protein ACET4U_21930 [Pseudomonas aeruginosa]
MNVGLSAEVRYHWFREHLVVVGDWHRLSPSERDRLRHQPMPDEVAQSLRVDLSPWSCGMVFSELLGADLTRFGLCYLAPAEVPASDLTRLGRRLREEFPLLDSQVDSGAEGFELVVHGQPEESPALEVGPFADENALIAALLQRPHSLFERGLLRLFHGRCGGRARWGVWLHHLVADADFASVLLARLPCSTPTPRPKRRPPSSASSSSNGAWSASCASAGPGWKTTGASAARRSVNWRACPGRSAPAIARISAWLQRQEAAKPPC